MTRYMDNPEHDLFDSQDDIHQDVRGKNPHQRSFLSNYEEKVQNSGATCAPPLLRADG